MKNKNPKTKGPYDGLQENVRKLKMPAIEVWENKYQDKDYVVRLETSEFTCICPRTGLPDFAAIKIEYIPDKWCLELKSFKNYIVSYRDTGIFHEHLTNKILEDIVSAAKPRWVHITAEFNIRGGIKITILAEYPGLGHRKKK